MPFWCCTACAAMAADARAPPLGEVVDGGRQHEARRVVARHHYAVDVAHDLVRAQGGARLLVARTDLSASVWFEGSQVTSTVCFCHKTSCLELPHTVRTRWSTTEPGAGIELAYLAAITALSGLAARGCVHAARVFFRATQPACRAALRPQQLDKRPPATQTLRTHTWHACQRTESLLHAEVVHPLRSQPPHRVLDERERRGVDDRARAVEVGERAACHGCSRCDVHVCVCLCGRVFACRMPPEPACASAHRVGNARTRAHTSGRSGLGVMKNVSAATGAGVLCVQRATRMIAIIRARTHFGMPHRPAPSPQMRRAPFAVFSSTYLAALTMGFSLMCPWLSFSITSNLTPNAASPMTCRRAVPWVCGADCHASRRPPALAASFCAHPPPVRRTAHSLTHTFNARLHIAAAMSTGAASAAAARSASSSPTAAAVMLW